MPAPTLVRANQISLSDTFAFTGPNTHSGTETFKNINNVLYSSQFSGADMGLKINAAAISLGSAGGTVIADQSGAQTWSTDIFNGVTGPVTILFPNCPTITVNTAATPRISGTKVLGQSIGCPTFFLGNATGDLFDVAGTATYFEFGNATVRAGVPLTSPSTVVSVTGGANSGYVHDLFLRDTYNNFSLAGSASGGVSNWVVRRIYWNGSDPSVHTGYMIFVGTHDGVIGSGDNLFSEFVSIGDVATHDTEQISIDSGSDTVKFDKIDLGYSASNLSTQPTWRFRNDFPGLFAPRWIRISHSSPEAPNATCFEIGAGTNLTFEAMYAEGCNIGMHISGGNGIDITQGSIFGSNKNGGIYVDGGLANLHLSINGVKFGSNSTATTNTTDDINVGAGTTFWGVTNSSFGQAFAGGGVSRYGINGSGDNYKIANNLVNTAGLGTAFSNGVSLPGLTLKKGSGGGNYTNATTSYTVADATNLCFTVTIPTGWKLGVSASGALSTATAAVVAQAALTDNAACSTANAGLLVETAPIQGAAIGVADSFALNWVITGDGAAHNIALQFKTSNVADTASLINSSATVTPTMKFELMPSN